VALELVNYRGVFEPNWGKNNMRAIILAVSVSLAILSFNSSASAASCSDAKDKCMKVVAGVRGAQGMNPSSKCVAEYDKCLQTGVWSTGAKPVKGLSKN
jgi:hypothetical protein